MHENIAVQFMNSIFSNALPGEKEEDHIYTLKEIFEQKDNEENNENNNDQRRNYNNSNQIMEQRNISPSNKYKQYNSKDFNDSNNKVLDYNSNNYNRNRSNSKSSRSRGRDRERSRDRERERSSSRKYSRSNSRNYRRSHQRNDDYRKRYDKPKNTGRYQKQYSKFCCVENGINKISTQFTVPEHLVSLLIGKNGENVKSIMHNTGASVTFCKEVSINFNI